MNWGDYTVDFGSLLALVVIATVAYIGGRMSQYVQDLTVPERIDLMQARAKHLTGIVIICSLIGLAVVVFSGTVDIKDPFISALIVQFLNTLKDLTVGPSLNYFPRPEHKAAGLVSQPKEQETTTTTTTVTSPPPVVPPPPDKPVP